MTQSVFLILGSHLFPVDYLSKLKNSHILMVEDFELFTRFKYHKKRLVFYIESMRNYADLLRDNGFEVTYVKLNKEVKHKSFELHLKELLEKLKIHSFDSYEIEDRFFRRRLLSFAKENQCHWQVHKSPMFLHSSNEFFRYFKSKKNPIMRLFYEAERKKTGILMQGGKPVGGKFIYDHENRKRLPKSIEIPRLPELKNSVHHTSVCKIVKDLFSDHPGDADNFWLPVTHQTAEKWLEVFLENRFHNFGAYEDAISSKEPFIFHSTLSPLLNIGLLTPEKVVEKALDMKDVPLNSMEGFIRQIIGWREFIRGIDECYGARQENANFFKHERLLGDCWWSGETGLEPVDHCIKSVIKYGYSHHIERLMVLSNVMLLCEVHPSEVYRWFMEMFIDSADWVMGPNVYGMGQFSDGGIFATKPYICGSNYIRKMSDFPKGDWCDIFDGLYWKFIDKRQDFFSAQPRLNMMLATLKRMPEERQKHLFSVASEFQEKCTLKK
ncbi:MAG: cryptochrome/photolyase family protein [Chlamydiota bacterium]|nr:cryptochrome/photolyase family protein [Chlamydiota bacterium]